MSGEMELRKPMTWRGKRLAAGDRIDTKEIVTAVGESRLASMIRLGWIAEAPKRPSPSRRRPSKPEEETNGQEEGDQAPPADEGD